MQAAENLQSFATQNTKSKLIRRIARLVRRMASTTKAGGTSRKKVRQLCQLRPGKKARKLPRVLTTDEFRRFYTVVDKCGNAQHGLMLRLLFYTGIRVSELVGLKVSDVDLDAHKIRILCSVCQVVRRGPAWLPSDQTEGRPSVR